METEIYMETENFPSLPPSCAMRRFSSFAVISFAGGQGYLASSRLKLIPLFPLALFPFSF